MSELSKWAEEETKWTINRGRLIDPHKDALIVRQTKDAEEVFMQEIIKRLTKKDKLLNIGCGKGQTAVSLTDRCYQVIGIDPTPIVLQKAQQRLLERRKENVFFIQADGRKMPFGEWEET